MKQSERSFLTLILPTAFLVLILSYASNINTPSPPFLTDTPTICASSPQFKPGYELEANSILPLSHNGFSFQGVSYLVANVCRGGKLKITAQGDIANGIAPVLQISLNSRIISMQSFDDLRTVTIDVPSDGQLVLGYFNDYFRADVRLAKFESIRVDGCKESFKPNMSLNSNEGGSVDQYNYSASLYSSTVLKIQTCQSGILSTTVSGTMGNGRYPTIIFVKNKTEVYRFESSSRPQRIKVFTEGKDINVRIINPYAKVIGNRNLNIYDLQYVPDL